MTPLAFLAKVFTARRGLLPLVVVLALLSSGCAMKAYEGPELPRSEIAVLDRIDRHGSVLVVGFAAPIPIPLPAPGSKHVTRIDEIDRKKVNRGRIHILPGSHTVSVSYWRHSGVTLCVDLIGVGCTNDYHTRDLSIDFMAKAGHEYRIPAERRDERNWIWVEDITTGKVVAGEKPPDDKGEGKNPAKPSELP